MSRELKLALILGFAAVMVVGVLISDHMSGARQARIEERTIDPPRMAMVTPPPAVIPEPMTTRGQEAFVSLPEPETARPERTPVIFADATGPVINDPVVITMSPEPIDTQSGALVNAASDSVREFLEWTARQGVVLEQVPALAETSRTPIVRPQSGVMASPAPERVTPPTGREVRHVVGKNETLWGIAQRYYGDGSMHTRIAEANQGRLGKNNALYVGATLTIPGATRDSAAVQPPPAPKTQTQPVTPPARQNAAPTKASSSERTYVVRRGETLGEIASKELGSARRWPEIVKLNKLDDPDNVPAGVRLRLPPR